jgi:hypothetical protein
MKAVHTSIWENNQRSASHLGFKDAKTLWISEIRSGLKLMFSEFSREFSRFNLSFSMSMVRQCLCFDESLNFTSFAFLCNYCIGVLSTEDLEELGFVCHLYCRLEARRREPKKPPFKFLVPLIYAPVLPLSMFSLLLCYESRFYGKTSPAWYRDICCW